jgi:hypothetical protein
MVMEWREMHEMLASLPAPEGYTTGQLARADLGQITELLRSWYPDIWVGTESRHLEPGFYEREFFLKGEERDRPLIGLVVRSADSGEIVGYQTLERNLRGLQIWGPLGVVEPSRRGRGLGFFGTKTLETIGRSIGAEVALYFSTLRVAQAQKNAEKQGYRLVGLVPAFDVDRLAPGVTRRVYEGLYAKVLVAEERVHLPDWNEMIPSTRALYRQLFGRHPADTE